MSTCTIITHRGLQPTRVPFYGESTFASFKQHLNAGFGIEVDLNFIQDGIVLFHDVTLKRLSQGKDRRKLQHMSSCELKAWGDIATLEELLDFFSPQVHRFIALHFKGPMQTLANVQKLIFHLQPYRALFPHLLLFDVLPAYAKIIKRAFAELPLGASVSAQVDIDRFQSSVGDTLLSVEQFLDCGKLYTWAWLDEWDRTSCNSRGALRTKKFYTPKTFAQLGSYCLAVVSPELHATSPGLLGGELHPDGNQNHLWHRLREILALRPHAICTDYPEEVFHILKEMSASADSGSFANSNALKKNWEHC